VNPWAWVGIVSLAAWILLMFGIICWPTGKPMLWDEEEAAQVDAVERLRGHVTIENDAPFDGDQRLIREAFDEIVGWER